MSHTVPGRVPPLAVGIGAVAVEHSDAIWHILEVEQRGVRWMNYDNEHTRRHGWFRRRSSGLGGSGGLIGLLGRLGHGCHQLKG